MCKVLLANILCCRFQLEYNIWGYVRLTRDSYQHPDLPILSQENIPFYVLADRCEALPQLKNGEYHFVGVVPEYLMFSIAEYSCNDGYELVGKDYSVVCMPGGHWSSGS